MRKSGILLPVTSLPSDYGIGCFDKNAYGFIDFLARSGQSFWQILPLGHTGFGDSPYQCFSAFAGNPYMISLDGLIEEGLLTREECDECDFGEKKKRIDYGKLYQNRYPLLKKAFLRSNVRDDPRFKRFEDKNSDWLFDYSFFMALKDYFSGKSWLNWPEDIRTRHEESLKKYSDMLENEILFREFIQYKFFTQWGNLRSYAAKNGVSIIGDIPIYVSLDSADVWSAPSLFELDANFFPESVAGVPPDGFSKSGQLWGNPLYRWKEHEKDGFSWWIRRLKSCFSLFDYVRIDHFRGFDEYYSTPYGREDAVEGIWRKGPGMKLFDAVEKKLGKKDIIAEDLGFITDSVKELLKNSGFMGIKVLQFAFDSRDTGFASDYLPHNYPQNCVAYTGTHDNSTLLSWFLSISNDEKNSVRKYLCDFYTPNSLMYKPLLCSALQSPAKICILPIQDILGLDDTARINRPGTKENNWIWRLSPGMLNADLEKNLLSLTKMYGRA